MDKQQVWQDTLERLSTDISSASFSTWFQGTVALSWQEKVFIVGVPTTFAKSHLEGRYRDQICTTLCDVVGAPLKVQLEVSQNLRPESSAPPQQNWRKSDSTAFLVVITEETLCHKASVPDIPGCEAVGKTSEEAVQGIRKILQTYLNTLSNDHASIPKSQTTAQYIYLPLTSNQEQESSSYVSEDNISTISSIPSCSFCYKQQNQVARLYPGVGGHYICNECGDCCREMIKEGIFDLQQIKQALATHTQEAN